MMNRLLSFFGYLWALAMVPLVFLTFFGMNVWVEKFATITGIRISPWYTGGEVQQIISHPGYETLIHRPVFDGLWWERQKGFLQIDWKALDRLPELIDEEVDYDRDGRIDFTLTLNTVTGATIFVVENNSVVSVGDYFVYPKEQILRINLINKNPWKRRTWETEIIR